jgi:MarR family transcriptional regulator, 2-MHQ and catechol-resistance regulon repressor
MPTHYRGKQKDVLALDTFIKFTRAASALETRLFKETIIEDLTPSQFGVLEILLHLGSLCQGELSTKLLRSTGNMTMVLDNLEKRGFVRRERDMEDRRMVMIHLTPAGQQIIERVFPQVVAKISSEFAILTAEEQEVLGRACKILGKQSRP